MSGYSHRSVDLLNAAYIRWIGVDASSTTTPTLVSDEKGNNAMGFAVLYPSYGFGIKRL